MARCNPTMYPGADGCQALAVALFSAGIAGAVDVECLKSCSGCASDAAAARIRSLQPSAAAAASSPRRRR